MRRRFPTRDPKFMLRLALGVCPQQSSTMRVTIIIKTLNEEANVARAIESALAAVATMGGEVVLADSLSTDRTVAIASEYPIRIARLRNSKDRCCGAAAQLGFQYARGEFVYVLDGDMRLLPGFLEAAIATMEQHRDVAGVGGRVSEKNLQSMEFQLRQQKIEHAPDRQPGPVRWLSGGGLYRKAALDQVGFCTNPNLHAFEEFDLGVRLRDLGWRLMRIPMDAAEHYGYTTDAYTLLLRRWRSNYLSGTGEVLRGAVGRSHFWAVVRELSALRTCLAVCLWWAVLVGLWLLPASLVFRLVVFIALLALPVLVMWARKGSLLRGTYSLILVNFLAAGFLRGLIRKQRDARRVLESELVRDATTTTSVKPAGAAAVE